MTDRARGMRITVSENGPYFVEGDVPLVRAEIVTNEQGESVAWRETEHIGAGESYALCRCGKSKSKPFCDFSHLEVGFDGTETAGHGSYSEMASRTFSRDFPGPFSVPFAGGGAVEDDSPPQRNVASINAPGRTRLRFHQGF